MSAVTVTPWAGRRAREALARVKAAGRAARSPCVICDQPIDYALEYPDGSSCSVQHVRSRRLFPELTWERSNWAPAHLDCNRAAGAAEAEASALGVVSWDW